MDSGAGVAGVNVLEPLKFEYMEILDGSESIRRPTAVGEWPPQRLHLCTSTGHSLCHGSALTAVLGISP